MEEEFDEQEIYVDNRNEFVKPQKPTILIKPSMRLTSSSLTRAEATRAISIRAERIARGDPVYTDVAGISTARDQAIKELYDGKNPLIVVRVYNGYREEFEVKEMRLPDKFRDDFPVPV